jgi:electron transfer flavoprotein alpha subunit
MNGVNRDIWVFGDYRNYFQNRVTLQLLAKATEMAGKTGGRVCAVVVGSDVGEYIREYIAHGADKVYTVAHPALESYSVETYSTLLVALAKDYQPETILIGGTAFGREMAPRVAKRLGTGLTADCIELDIDVAGLLVQTAPSFGGNLLAKIITPSHRPQMATVRPGVFKEIPHDDNRSGEIVRVPYPQHLPRERVRLISMDHTPPQGRRMEDAPVVVCGGRGMGSRQKFRKLYDLARLTNGEVGATRPVVYAKWADHDSLVGQAGRQVKPQVLFSFGISGAIQHTAAIGHSDFIIAVNKNPNATMMKLADVAIVADASQVCSALIKALRERIRS